jgi:hypothetical protein
MQHHTIALLGLAACYPAAPAARPQIPAPTLPADTALDVTVGTGPMKTTTKTYTCPRRDGVRTGEPCYWKSNGGREVPTAEVRAGDTPLRRGEVMALAIPDQLERFDRARSACKTKQIPRYIGGVLALGGIIVIAAGGSFIDDNKTRYLVGGGAIAAGGLAYGVGYLLGGGVCHDAKEIGDELTLSWGSDTTWYDEDVGLATKLVEDFNAKHRAAAPRPTSTPTE